MINFYQKTAVQQVLQKKLWYMQKRIQREAKKIVDLVSGNNIKFYWKVALSRIIISDNRLK